MALYKICSKKLYEKNGEKKVTFYDVGFLKITDAGKKYLTLFIVPQTEFHFFEKDESLPEIQIEEPAVKRGE